MVVEDNKDILFQVELILDLNGYEVVSALNGEKALELLSQMERLPDLIISDIIMPKMDGYDFLRELSLDSKYRNIPFMFATAKTAPQDIRLAKLIGADDYLIKPFKEKDLLDIIQNKLSKAKILEEIKVKIKNSLEKFKNSTEFKESIIIEEEYYLYLMIWEENEDLTLYSSYPDKVNTTISVTTISSEVFFIFDELKKKKKINLPESMLIDLPYFKKQGFFYYDALIDLDVEKKFILALIGPDLNYFKSLKLHNIFSSIAEDFKNNLSVDLKSFRKDLFRAISE